MSVLKAGSVDPRVTMDVATLEEANQQILSPVAMPAGLSPGLKLGILGIGLLGILTFTTLATGRSEANQTVTRPAGPTKGMLHRKVALCLRRRYFRGHPHYRRLCWFLHLQTFWVRRR